jgi:hypothetical protein
MSIFSLFFLYHSPPFFSTTFIPHSSSCFFPSLLIPFAPFPPLCAHLLLLVSQQALALATEDEALRLGGRNGVKSLKVAALRRYYVSLSTVENCIEQRICQTLIFFLLLRSGRLHFQNGTFSKTTIRVCTWLVFVRWGHSYLSARGLPVADNDEAWPGGRHRYQKRELAEIVVEFLGL